MSLLLGLAPHSFVCAGTNNATSAKATAGQLGNTIHIANVAVSPRYWKFYDKASAPDPAVDVPVFVVSVAASSFNNVTVQNGLAFNKGIAYLLVTGIGNTDNTAPSAADCVCSYSFL